MAKIILAKLHWLLGITAGTVLAMMGVTGALLSFQDPLLEWLNREAVTVAVPATPRLPMHEFMDKIAVAYPGKQVMNITVYAANNHATRVTLVADAPKEAAAKETAAEKSNQKPGQGKQAPRRRGEVRYVNPYSGELLGNKELTGQPTLRIIEQIHRGMIAGPAGRAVVGACAISLFVLALSGLYLRWPRAGALKWRTWFKVNNALKGRPFLWNLHTVIATCVLPVYLTSSLTGMYLAYDWYRQGVIAMVGATPPSREVTKLDVPANEALNIDAVWTAFEQANTNYNSATLSLPQSREQAVEIRYLGQDAKHERAFNLMAIHPVTGAVLKHELFIDKNFGNQVVGSIFPLHSGDYFGVIGKIITMLACLTMPLFAITGWMMYLHRRRSKQPAFLQSAQEPC